LTSSIGSAEKYGMLRFYFFHNPPEGDYPPEVDEIIWDLTETAERNSGYICEVCGSSFGRLSKTGSPEGYGWYKTLCKECRAMDAFERYEECT